VPERAFQCFPDAEEQRTNHWTDPRFDGYNKTSLKREVHVVKTPEKIRTAVVAGKFYPDDPVFLKKQVQEFLKKARSYPDPKVRGLIVPHAGYPYSGPVAAEAYKKVEGRRFDFVVVIAFLHRLFLEGVLVDDVDFYETPLGRIPVETSVAAAIRGASPYLNEKAQGSLGEHSLEVQLPFLQVAVPDLRIVPVYIGEQSFGNAEALAMALAKQLRDRNALVVISTDLSHFHSYDVAVGKDKKLIKMLEKRDLMNIGRASQSGEVEACGLGPVISGMLLAGEMGWTGPELIHYANSGDATGDRSSVVGYAAMAFKESGKR